MALYRRTRSTLLAVVLIATTSFTPSAGTVAADRPSEDQLANLWARAAEAGALGMYRADDGTVVIVMSATKADAFTTEDARATGLAARVETRDIDAETIAAIDTHATGRDWPGAPLSAAYGVYFDAELGRVVIEGDAPPATV